MAFFHKLSFVKKQLDNDDCWTFYFATPKSLRYKAGQHGLFVIPGLYQPHPFTMSSAPEEEYMAVSTRVRAASRYKQKMMRIKPGEAMFFVGPILNYTFKANVKNYVFLAQGIGITPFRSMLVHAHSQSLPVSTTLIHVDGRHHTFKEVTKKFATHSFYPSDPEEFRRLVSGQDVSAGFYLSGSPKFISATRQLLVEQGVKRSHIRVDSFIGY